MVDSAVATVRRFNRTVTRRMGVLDDHFLGRPRPLAASRLLFEIGTAGADGVDVRALRDQLGLDSGYTSRLLRSLESEGLVETAASPGDGRVRRAVVTAAGRAEVAECDRLSDRAAAAVLDPLSADQRRRLADAMGEVERLLRAAAVTIDVADPAADDSRRCLASYFAELGERFEDGFDAGIVLPADADDLVPPRGVWMLARLDGEAIGCGALVCTGDGVADVKRMWVSPAARGLGLGRRILDALEAEAPGLGVHTLRLETNRALTEALALYRSAGYVEGPPHNDEVHAHHWFHKRLGTGG